jgi:hypothetical protein
MRCPAANAGELLFHCEGEITTKNQPFGVGLFWVTYKLLDVVERFQFIPCCQNRLAFLACSHSFRASLDRELQRYSTGASPL